jgi:hypothetical protein
LPRTVWAALALCLLLTLPRRGLGDTATEARAQALRLSAEGAEAYRAEKYPEALAKFSAAYRNFPASPLLLNISRAALKLRRCADAIRYGEQYRLAATSGAASPDAPDDWLAMIRRECIDAEILSTPAGAAVWIDDERQTAPESTPWTGRLTIGQHKVLLWKPGFQQAAGQLNVSADAPARLAIALLPEGAGGSPNSALVAMASPPAATPPAPPGNVQPSPPPHAAPPAPVVQSSAPSPRPRPGLRWEPFVPAGATVVGLALAIAGGVLSAQCPTKVGPASDVYAAEVCQYNRAGLADVGWGLTGAGAVTAGLLWWVLKPAASGKSSAHIALTGSGTAMSATF